MRIKFLTNIQINMVNLRGQRELHIQLLEPDKLRFLYSKIERVWNAVEMNIVKIKLTSFEFLWAYLMIPYGFRTWSTCDTIC